jgi:glucose-1-phosphatase
MSDRRVVLLDLGGVVVRICRTWEEACARAGVTPRDPELFHRDDLTQRRRHIVEQYQTGRIECEVFYTAISDASAGLYTPDEVRRVHHAWTLEDYPGVAALITRLTSTHRVTVGCLSNTNHAHWVILRDGGGAFPPSPAIEAMHRHLVSHHLRASKPGEEIYRKAEQEMGASPEQIVFFDDLSENIDAAKRRGWDGVVIDHTGDTAHQIETALRERRIIE